MMPSTIALSINSSWNILNFRRGLVERLLNDGFDVVALTPDDAMAPRLRALGVAHVCVPMDSAGLSPVADARLVFRYIRVLRDIRPDLFLGWTIKPNIYGSIAARLCGVPTINNVAGLGTAFLGSGWLMRLASNLYRVAFARSATVFFQNPDDRNLFLSQGLVRPCQAALLPGSGIDLTQFPVAPLTGIGEAMTFLMVARVLRDKGVREYVEAARRIRTRYPSARFQLLGPVDAANRTAIPRAEVEAWAAAGTIEYIGAAEDVRPHLSAADCIVLPSYREGLPRTLLEGAAMGRPLIATDVPGCRDVIEDGVNGLSCRAKDADSLADAMATILRAGTSARTAMGQAGRALVEARFEENVVIELYIDAIRRALHQD